MVHMRFDKRRTPIIRLWAMMETDVVKEKPPWYDACRMFPPSSTLQSGTKTPPKLRYLHDTLLEQFHDLYLRRFNTPYQGVNHLHGIKDPKRGRRTYRDIFVEKQAQMLKADPSLTIEDTFDTIASSGEMEHLHRLERNKKAIMTRWMLDPKSENLNESLTEIQQRSELKSIAFEIRNLRKNVRSSREQFKVYKQIMNIDAELELLSRKDEDDELL